MQVKEQIFLHEVSNPANVNNLNISTDYLDPLMGINSVDLAVKESALNPDPGPEQEGWGEDPNGMWTPYPWLHLMFKDLDLAPNTRIIDIGAGIGRLGVYLKVFRPEVTYMGLEKFESRVAAARAIGLDVFKWDLVNGLPKADLYYYYNALPPEAYVRMIADLKQYQARGEVFRVVSARDPYKGFKTFLKPIKRIRIDYPFEHEFVIYTSEVG